MSRKVSSARLFLFFAGFTWLLLLFGKDWDTNCFSLLEGYMTVFLFFANSVLDFFIEK
ncbi:MAG: hypothetical protein ABIG89_02100 [Candidatus Woesearchaeota archaeon]